VVYTLDTMSTLKDFFPLARVINLPERRDRYRAIERQLAMLGMQFAPGEVEVFAAKRPDSAAGFPGIGARGCFLSHLEVLKDARDRGLESILIIEDDLEVLPANVSRLNAIVDQAKDKRWGIMYLGHVEELDPVSEPQLISYDSPIKTSHMYGVHHSALGPLIEYLERCLLRPPGDPVGGPMHYDGALTMFRASHPEVVTLIAQPSLGGQRSSRSDITPRRLENMQGLKQIVAALRFLWNKLSGGRRAA
jgi:hypothetical protein